MRYNHRTIERKWQKYWTEKKLFEAQDESAKPKYYCLIEFPYPSGEGLHVGHPRSYTALDILARKRRMQGYNVLYPFGFDAFGLPSENYAIKTGIHPLITTKKNIKIFTKQLKALGLSFDWARQVVTTDPNYYQWTQWIFLKMFKAGLAYKKKMAINWCPSCKIGLANEEVVSGKCERCGTEVIKKEKEQWLLKITNYADRLIKDLDSVDYLERIKTSQINWIGRSEGAEVDFPVVIASPAAAGRSNPEIASSVTSGDLLAMTLKVFTTRPDTLFGATFMVVAPEHSLIVNSKSLIVNWPEVENYLKQASKKSELERSDLQKEKTGVELKGLKAINPVNGQEIPIFVADYVSANYGTGAIMAVPGHDQRDWDFAKKYNLPIIEVISGGDIAKAAYEEIEKGVLVNSGEFNGLAVKEAIGKITDWLEQKKLGKKAINYKLRDWVFSRQRYWGEPIPLIFCENCKKNSENKLSKGELLNPGWIAVSESELPIKLPRVKKYEPTDTGESPLATMTNWVKTKCPKCGGKAIRETDTMPNWAGSNWYFIRYLDPQNKNEMAALEKMAYWLPVDWYNGGMEHTTLHLLYSRFVYKFLYDIGAVPKNCGPEPYKKRTSHGLILGEGGEKMSKSKGNVVNPDEIVKIYGADAFRAYEMFMGPFDQAIPWDTHGLIGVRRFLERVYSVVSKIVKDMKKSKVPAPGGSAFGGKNKKSKLIHKTIKKVSQDIETQAYNTAVSALMIQFNGVDNKPDWRPKLEEMKKNYNCDPDALEKFLILLSPFAPHLSEDLWQKLGHQKSIFQESWPTYDENLISESEIELVIQINGKVRGRLRVASNANQTEIEALAKNDENIKKYLADAKIKKVIFVFGRLINFVI